MGEAGYQHWSASARLAILIERVFLAESGHLIACLSVNYLDASQCVYQIIKALNMSAVVLWLVFPPVTRKTRAQFPAAELFNCEDNSPSPRLWGFARLVLLESDTFHSSRC